VGLYREGRGPWALSQQLACSSDWSARKGGEIEWEGKLNKRMAVAELDPISGYSFQPLSRTWRRILLITEKSIGQESGPPEWRREGTLFGRDIAGENVRNNRLPSFRSYLYIVTSRQSCLKSAESGKPNYSNYVCGPIQSANIASVDDWQCHNHS